MIFVRTVLGDIDAADLGVCDAHEHIIIGPCFATENEPDYLLDDVDRAVDELKVARTAGLRSVIDTMPGQCGRDIHKLATVSKAAHVHIVAPTGVHLEKYYPPDHPILQMCESDLADWMIGEIDTGADGSWHRCGVIKIAGGRDRLSNFERTVFLAAARAHRATGCPIITHTEAGTACDEQIDLLENAGVDLSRLTLSHTDRNPDVDAHRRWLKRGVNLEYDNHFRKPDGATTGLIRTLISEYPDQLMLGMDAARRSYWNSYGGKPGLAYLVTTLRRQLSLPNDVLEHIYTLNPARAFSFSKRGEYR